MNTFDKFVSILKAYAERIRLEPHIRTKVRLALASYADLHEVQEQKAARTPKFGFLEDLGLYAFRAGFALFTLAVGAGGVAYASGNALPGDALYSVKVGMVEPLESAILMEPETKAAWSAILAERRLEEAATLATRDALTDETRTYLEERFTYHAERSDAAAEEVELSGKSEVALMARSDLEARLAAHADLFLYLSEEGNTAPLYEKVAKKRDEVAHKRHESEQRIAERTLAYSDRQLEDAEEQTEEVVRKLEEAGIDNDEVRSRILAAREALISARSSHARNEGGVAFVATQAAARLTHEANILAKNRSIIALGLPSVTTESAKAKEKESAPNIKAPAVTRPAIMLKAPAPSEQKATSSTKKDDKKDAEEDEERSSSNESSRDDDASSNSNGSDREDSNDSSDNDSSSDSDDSDRGSRSLRDTVRNTVNSLLGN